MLNSAFKTFIFFALMLAFMCGGLHSAFAQSSRLPGFSVPREDSNAVPNLPLANLNEQMFSNYETAFLKLRNRMLSDTLLLQYQINLLKILIKRQSEIDNIAKSFESLNINFNQPAPDKSICEKLPENLLCMLFYPEMFDIDVEAYTNPQPLPAPVVSMPQPATTTGEATGNQGGQPAAAALPPEEEDVTTPFLWSDIQCAAGSCRAVLVDRRAPARRFTVRPGEELPDESVITQISYNGVTVRKEDETLRVEPAPADGAIDAMNGGEENEQAISNILRSRGLDTPAPINNNAPANEAPANGQAESQGSLFSDIPAPAQDDNAQTSGNAPTPVGEPSTLGPTGLF